MKGELKRNENIKFEHSFRFKATCLNSNLLHKTTLSELSIQYVMKEVNAHVEALYKIILSICEAILMIKI